DWELCRHFSDLKIYDCPLLAAVSRKRFIGDALQKPAQECLSGSLAVLAYLIEAGAHILRVHDVAETRDVVTVFGNLLNK
ncbi:MAG TPA: dihydropteroate synthase, partial [Methanocorpusculum sp.]|nr:dihydropteroate synthase [Methanocorpusculum sp.]